MSAWCRQLQQSICSALEQADGRGRFGSDSWSHTSGGGGLTRVLERGAVIEKGGVNTSAVTGELPPSIARRLNLESVPFAACGISLVIHPESPFVPTIHANYRYFELPGDRWWFGGGCDLTPWYAEEEDIRHFHRTLRAVCDRYDPDWYPRYKQQCDAYFTIRHRKETRGAGGLFFDDLTGDRDRLFAWIGELGASFTESYLPILHRRKNHPVTDANRHFHELMRGRYVEFNLVYDKGTLFGLETNGRVESILMSLPPRVRWEYHYQPEPGSPEANRAHLLIPRDWV